MFKASLLPCCNRDMCDDPYVTCYSNSSADVLPDPTCDDITISCMECIDLTNAGELCSGGTDVCWDQDHECYYNGTWNCNK